MKKPNSPAKAARAELTAKTKKTRLDQSGVNTRGRSHLKAANRRAQGKRDSR